MKSEERIEKIKKSVAKCPTTRLVVEHLSELFGVCGQPETVKAKLPCLPCVVNLSVDQLGLFTKAGKATGLFPARSVAALNRSFSVIFRTERVAEISPNSMSSNAIGEHSDKMVLIRAMKDIIEWVRNYNAA